MELALKAFSFLLESFGIADLVLRFFFLPFLGLPICLSSLHFFVRLKVSQVQTDKFHLLNS